MIFIAVKFPVKPEYADQWIEKTRAFTEATRAEEAGPHVNSDHFQQAMKDMRPMLTATPKIISRLIDGDDWEAMGELQID